MRTGSRIVLGLALLAGVAVAVLQIYGVRAASRHGPDSATAALRETVQADNTLVGLLGGIRELRVIEEQERDEASARLEATVVGSRDSGWLVADLSVREGRWRVRSASVTLSDGRRIPIAGS